jgi:tryptophan-rich sensory protein
MGRAHGGVVVMDFRKCVEGSRGNRVSWSGVEIIPMQTSGNIARRRDFGMAALALAAVVAASLLGQLATYPNLVPWYAGLAKPSFNPPNWVFAPAWTTLYGLMALAGWRILRLPPSPLRRTALLLFFGQLALNVAWSWMFFAAQSPLLGLVNVIPQWLVIVATIVTFARLDQLAAWCLVPLAAWVAYAAILNAAIWWLNG